MKRKFQNERVGGVTRRTKRNRNFLDSTEIAKFFLLSVSLLSVSVSLARLPSFLYLFLAAIIIRAEWIFKT